MADCESESRAASAQCGVKIRPLKALNAPSATTDFPRIWSFVPDGITSC